MRRKIIIFAFAGVAAAIGLEVIFIGKPDAGAETTISSSGISPEGILRNLPARFSLPIAEHENAI